MTKSELRKEYIRQITTFMDTLDGDGSNSGKFLSDTSPMTDDEFFEYFKDMLEDEQGHLYIEFRVMENEPDYETCEKATLGTGARLYSKVVYPEFEDQNGIPYVGRHDMTIIFAPQRKVQQNLTKKNSVPLDTSQRNPKTGQVTGGSKGGRVSDSELFAQTIHDVPNIIREMYYFKAGNDNARMQLLDEIATQGTASLEGKDLDRTDNAALMTADMLLRAAAMDSDLIQGGNILPRTLKQGGKQSIRGLNRKRGSGNEQ